jgi:large subunit ribosomal protein L18
MECPRLAIFRSINHIFAQVINDEQGVTLVSASSLDSEAGLGRGSGGNIAGAMVVGAEIAKRARAQGIERVVCDRGGYRYHGRVKALADAARESGLKF